MEMREDESRVGEAAEMLARLKALGGDIHAFHRERAQRAARPSAPEKGCVVCREADPVGNVSADCAHPPSLCEECLPRVPDACPICRATAPCTSEADAAAAAAAPPADPPAAD